MTSSRFGRYILPINVIILMTLLCGCNLPSSDDMSIGPTSTSSTTPTTTSTFTPTIRPVPQLTQISSNPNARPVLGNLIISPSTPVAGNLYEFWIKPGKVIVSVSSVQNATQVSFYESPHGTGVTPQLIGVDSNLSDGASVIWIINERSLLNSVWAEARNANHLTASTEIYTVIYEGNNK